MSYILCLGLNIKLYKTPPRVRVFLNNIFIDEFIVSTNTKLHNNIPQSKDPTYSWNYAWADSLVNLKKKHGLLNPIECTPQLYKITEFFTNHTFLKFFELDKKYMNSVQKHNLKIEILNNDNNYTNGFLTKSTYIVLSIVYLIPKKILIDYKNFCNEYLFTLKNLRSTHKNISEILYYYKGYNFKFDILNYKSKNKKEKLVWIDNFGNRQNIDTLEQIGITGYTELFFDKKIFTYNKLELKKEDIGTTLLYSLGNKYTQYENQRSNNS